MQTFLPYPDFAASAAALDPKRLGKQRVEALQVLRALTRVTYGWKRHPAVRMWVGYAEGVGAYGQAMCLEWVARGGADTVSGTIGVDLSAAGLPSVPRTQQELARVCALPEWIGDERVHRSHRAALVRKDPAYYGPLFPDADPEMPYFWPVERAAGRTGSDLGGSADATPEGLDATSPREQARLLTPPDAGSIRSGTRRPS